MKTEQYIIDRAKIWAKDPFDDKTKAEVQDLLNKGGEELTNSFYKDLDFGTGGMRGIMGVGTNRMNKYTVGMTTQGLANYLLKTYPNKTIKVAISYDCRNNNTFFANTVADVLTANGIEVYLFDELRPTPELSFAIRELGCDSGIMITASHNPKEYNGYKVYWNDGAQVVPPHDKNIIHEVRQITDVNQVKFEGNKALLHRMGKEMDEKYIQQLKTLSLSPELIKQQGLKIVYTPIHGTGVDIVPKALRSFGFENVYHVEKQDIVDGNFPTVYSPNPEESAALEMAIEKAKAVGAELVMATDPDSDRVGIAVRKEDGNFELFNGNQTATIMIYYLLNKWKELGKLTSNKFITKTVVTSEILCDIAKSYDVKCYDTLTGFKWIAELIREKEGKEQFIAGGEESYGYLIGDFVRDKDAVASCCIIAEAAAWVAAEKKMNLYQFLPEIYQHYGLYLENLISVKREGKAGEEEIKAWMKQYRENPPQKILNSNVTQVFDYQSSVLQNIKTGEKQPINLPKSNVLQFLTDDGTKITMRPSGTEPKIKYYFSVKAPFDKNKSYEAQKSLLAQKITDIIAFRN